MHRIIIDVRVLNSRFAPLGTLEFQLFGTIANYTEWSCGLLIYPEQFPRVKEFILRRLQALKFDIFDKYPRFGFDGAEWKFEAGFRSQEIARIVPGLQKYFPNVTTEKRY